MLLQAPLDPNGSSCPKVLLSVRSPGLCRQKPAHGSFLSRHPKGCFPAPPISTYTAASASFPQRWPEGGICHPRSHSFFPTGKHLVSKQERQPQSSLWNHLPLSSHSALRANSSKALPAPGPPCHHPQHFEPSYSPRKKRLISATRPAPASLKELLATADGSPTGVKVCLTAGKLLETSSKGAGSEQSLWARTLVPHFFSSLSSGKRKKKKQNPYLTLQCPHTMNF